MVVEYTLRESVFTLTLGWDLAQALQRTIWRTAVTSSFQCDVRKYEENTRSVFGNIGNLGFGFAEVFR